MLSTPSLRIRQLSSYEQYLISFVYSKEHTIYSKGVTVGGEISFVFLSSQFREMSVRKGALQSEGVRMGKGKTPPPRRTLTPLW